MSFGDVERKELWDEIESFKKANNIPELLEFYHASRGQRIFEEYVHDVSSFLFSKRKKLLSMALHQEGPSALGATAYLVDNLEAVGWGAIRELLASSCSSEIPTLILEALKDRLPVSEQVDRLKLPLVEQQKLVALLRQLPSNTERTSVIAEIAATVCDPLAIKEIMFSQKSKPCRIHGGVACHISIEKQEFFFIAYDSRHIGFRDVVKATLQEQFPRLGAVDYTERFTDRSIFCKICERIQQAKFCVFDLSGDDTSDRPNHNVMLELGVAICVGSPVIMCLKEGTKDVSDLGGVEKIYYKNDEELVATLRDAKFGVFLK